MKKIISSIIMASVMLLGSITIGCEGADATTSFNERLREKGYERNNKVAVFYIPHQDDEVLSMGFGITNHIQQGYNVHLVLVTDGSASAVRKKLPNLTEQQFVNARNKEFQQSAKALGVKRQNVHYLNYKDGTVTKDIMKQVIMDFNSKYPTAVHRGYSYYDQHADHKVSGEAMRELYNEGKINKDVKLYINYHRYGTYSAFSKKEALFTSGKQKVINSANAYKLYKPKFGRYAIGYTSAGDLFKSLEKNPNSYYHLPNQ